MGLQTAGVGHRAGMFSGAQMWIAQPEATRHGASRFEHLPELPTVDLGTGEATVLIGRLGPGHSAARVDGPAVGLDVVMAPSVDIERDGTFEYAIVPIDRTILAADTIVEPGFLALVQPGTRPLTLAVEHGRGRALVLGGPPMERIQMWWDFVARTREEIADAWRDWQRHNTDRFGPVPSDLPRIDAPAPPWITTSD